MVFSAHAPAAILPAPPLSTPAIVYSQVPMTDVQLGGLEALEREKPVSHDGSGGDRTCLAR